MGCAESKTSSQGQILEKPCVCQGSDLTLAQCGLNLKDANRKSKHPNLFTSPISDCFYVGQNESR